MRIGIIGAGALGGLLAALLDRAGHEVVVTARGAQLDAIRSSGLRIEGGYGTHLARIPAAQVLPTRPELAVLAVKAQDAVAAATQNAHVLSDVPVVVVQNGIAGPQALREMLHRSPLIGGASMIAASYLEPGLVTVTARGLTVLARDTATRTELAAAAAVLGDAVAVRTAADLAGVQWAKLVVNQLNAAPAVTGLPLQEALASPDLARAITAAMRETVRVAEAEGVRLASPPLPAALRVALERLPLGLAARGVRRRVLSTMGTTPNPGSTLQSIRRGRPTEIDHLSGAVVAAGARLGVPTPVNAAIVAAVDEAAATGRFLAPDVAARRLL